MANNIRTKETEVIEQYRFTLFNSTKQTEIATELSNYGYSIDKIAEGKALLDKTIQAYNQNRIEDYERSEVYQKFVDQKEKLYEYFKKDRKKARVAFRKEPMVIEKLGVQNEPPESHAPWMDQVKNFYTVLSTDEAIKQKVLIFNMSAEEIEEKRNLVEEVEYLKSQHLVEVGESEEATQIKNSAFAELNDWMQEFYAVARLAMEDHPQLLEAFGKTIKA